MNSSSEGPRVGSLISFVSEFAKILGARYSLNASKAALICSSFACQSLSR